MARSTPPGTIQKSFHLDHDNAEWLRNQAHAQRTTQTVLVNRAIDNLRALSEGRLSDVLRGQASPEGEAGASTPAPKNE